VPEPTAESIRRRVLARRLAAGIVGAGFEPAAILLGGSAAEGISDQDSDIDLICYFDAVPDRGRFQAVLSEAGASFTHASFEGEAGFSDSYDIEGVELQTGGTRTARIEVLLDEVLRGDHVGEPITKAVSGLLRAAPLHGEARFEVWRASAASYPDELRRKSVEHHLRFFPIWSVDHFLVPRDALHFRVQMRLEVAFNVLGVLSALNRVYFTDFQFKRLRAHAAELVLSPPGLADRLERAMATHESFRALEDLRDLVAETVVLVERELPTLDTSKAHWAIDYRGR
jgi:hypothetical protein